MINLNFMYFTLPMVEKEERSSKFRMILMILMKTNRQGNSVKKMEMSMRNAMMKRLMLAKTIKLMAGLHRARGVSHVHTPLDGMNIRGGDVITKMTLLLIMNLRRN